MIKILHKMSFKYFFVGLLAFQLSGCTVLGLFIGTTQDNKYPDIENIAPYNFKSLMKDKMCSVTLKNNKLFIGQYVDFDSLKSEVNTKKDSIILIFKAKSILPEYKTTSIVEGVNNPEEFNEMRFQLDAISKIEMRVLGSERLVGFLIGIGLDYLLIMLMARAVF